MCAPSNETASFFSQVFPVITFIVGLIAAPIFQRISEIRRLKRVEEYFIQLLNSLHLQIDSQNKEILDCISRIDNDNNFDLVLNKVTGRNLVLIDRIDSKDLFKILIIRKKGNSAEKTRIFNEINSIIAFLNESITHAINSNAKMLEQIDQYRNDWNESQKSLQNLKNNFVISHNLDNSKKEDEFLSLVHNEMENFYAKYKKDLGNIYLAKHKLIDPLLDIVKKYPLESRAASFLAELQNSKLAFNEMQSTRKHHRKFLFTNMTNNAKIDKDLEKVIKEIRDLKNRKV